MSLWDLSYPSVNGDDFAPPPREPPATSQPAPARRPAPIPSSSRVNLEAWEKLCPLNDDERLSVTSSLASATDRPYPRHLLHDSASALDAGLAVAARAPAARLEDTPEILNAQAGPPKPPQQSSQGHSHLRALPTPVSTVQGFNDWFGVVADAIETESERRFHAYLEPVSRQLAICDATLSDLDDCRGLLREIEANWKFVDENAQSMERACEDMLKEQKHLDALASSTTERLDYFRRLEEAQRLLNLPGDAELVHRPEFLEMLDRLEVCLEFMKSNHTFRDADLYLVRFQQCLTRGMTLIKIYYTTTLSKTGQDAAEKIVGKEISETVAHALLYAKFAALAATMRPLVYELEKRVLSTPFEYGSLINECFGVWFGVRNSLVRQRVALEVGRITGLGVSADVVSVARSGCNYLRTVCAQEHGLFRDFFVATGGDEVGVYLESLCDILYDVLRPRILHEQKLGTLCELCTVLQALMALDARTDEDDEEDDPDVEFPASPTRRGLHPQDINFDPLSPQSTGPSRSDGHFRFAPLLHPILQDVQTRLVFRAQSIIQSEVLHYVPAPDDLDYPGRLRAAGASGVSWSAAQSDAEVGEALQFRLPPDAVQDVWYPTVRKTLWVLSKIHTYVNNTIFEDFAGEAVTQCRQSLSIASTQIRSRGNESDLDARLFTIRHLLILKEMVRTLDLVTVDRAIDLTPVTTVLGDLFRHSSTILNPNALFRLAAKGIPTFAETMRDAKLDLDGQLKSTCEDFIEAAVSRVTAELRNFLAKCSTYLSTASRAGAPAKDLPSQEWATSEAILNLHRRYLEAVEARVPDLHRSMLLYLEDDSTVDVLVKLLQRDILATYATFRNLVRAEYNLETGSALLASPEAHAQISNAFAPSKETVKAMQVPA